jgi:tRNA1Val (adenine37-N6)-methyltransferase
VEDKNCGMKIGTDACLLGAWADVRNVEAILDIGTGSGVIALMLAQRTNAKIDAVEIDDEAYRQASDNFDNSQWNDRLRCFHLPIQEYVKTCKNKYELIVCCPPYFRNHLKTGDKTRNLARHTDSLSFEDLLSASFCMLNPTGKFCTIIPSKIAKQFCDLALIEGYFPSRIMYVLPKEEATPVRTLLQLERVKKHCSHTTIAVLDKEGKAYTEEYKKLTKEFYINF